MIALVLFAALLDLQVESSSSISGRYSVQIGSEDRSGVLVLDVRGSRVRGAIGPTDQAPPFENGSIDGTTVTFTTGRAPIRWRLHFGGPTIEGEWRRGDEVVPLSVKRIDDLRTDDRLRLLPLLHYDDTANRSPRIVALREQLDTGEPGAVNAFWAAVAAQGTPLVEAIRGTDDAFPPFGFGNGPIVFLICVLALGAFLTSLLSTVRSKITIVPHGIAPLPRSSIITRLRHATEQPTAISYRIYSSSCARRTGSCSGWHTQRAPAIAKSLRQPATR
jgi:hypothetical protein